MKLLLKILPKYVIKHYTTDEAIKILINFWHKWGHTRERPLFIDAHLDVE
jgi:predicted phosphoadenosine phosphosulfate sulfurtransferase